MFCPKCGEVQISEQVHFCKHCGFRLDAVQELVAGDAEPDSPRESILAQQKRFSMGAALMFIGSVVAMFWAQAHRGADGDVLPQVFLILGFSLGFILLLFHPLLGLLGKLFSDSEAPSDVRRVRKRAAHRRNQRDGINLGALLMFLGTVKALALSTMVSDPGRRPALTIAIATVFFLMLLVIRWLIGGVHWLFFEKSAADEKKYNERVTAELPAAVKGRPEYGLPPAQHNEGIPVEVFTSRTAEVIQPVSVTEGTTGLLGKK